MAISFFATRSCSPTVDTIVGSLPMLALAANHGVYSYNLLFGPTWVALVSAAAFDRTLLTSAGAVPVIAIFHTPDGIYHVAYRLNSTLLVGLSISTEKPNFVPTVLLPVPTSIAPGTATKGPTSTSTETPVATPESLPRPTPNLSRDSARIYLPLVKHEPSQ
jgi:hypothetical protein